MSTYVLIHGAFHGGWCWDKVVPLLEKKGHTVVAPDLPGHGKDGTPIAQVSLQAYADHVCEVMSQQSELVVLVGHSMGGRVISSSAEQCPDRISTLVYLTAGLLRDGETSVPLPEESTPALINQNLILSDDGTYLTVRDEALKDIFYHDCTDEDVEWAVSANGLHGVAAADDTLYGVDLTDGSVRWTFSAGCFTAPAMAKVQVVVADDNGMLFVLNRMTGDLLWQTYLGGPLRAPIVSGDSVFVAGEDGAVYAFVDSG